MNRGTACFGLNSFARADVVVDSVGAEKIASVVLQLEEKPRRFTPRRFTPPKGAQLVPDGRKWRGSAQGA